MGPNAGEGASHLVDRSLEVARIVPLSQIKDLANVACGGASIALGRHAEHVSEKARQGAQQRQNFGF